MNWNPRLWRQWIVLYVSGLKHQIHQALLSWTKLSCNILLWFKLVKDITMHVVLGKHYFSNYEAFTSNLLVNFEEIFSLLLIVVNITWPNDCVDNITSTHYHDMILIFYTPSLDIPFSWHFFSRHDAQLLLCQLIMHWFLNLQFVTLREKLLTKKV